MELKATARETLGKQVKTLRREGQIPAEFYGHGMENRHLVVDGAEFARVLNEAGESTVINIKVGSDTLPAIIYDIQRHYMTLDPMHVDFYGVRMDEKVTTHVPIEFTGEAPAVREQGGVLNKTLDEIEVEALPGDLPPEFIVDLSVLAEIDQSIYIKDLDIPKGVEVLLDEDTVIVSVTPPREEEEEPVLEEVDLESIEVEGEEEVKARQEEGEESEGEEEQEEDEE